MGKEVSARETPETGKCRYRYSLYILLALFISGSLIYYLDTLADLFGWGIPRFFYSVHDVHRLFFLAPIIYAGYVFRVKGALSVTIAAFVIFLPRAFSISPFPDPLLRMTVFTVVAGAVGTLTGITRNESERRQQLETALRNERDKLLGILERMEDGVVIIGPDYRLRFMNPSMVREFGEGTGRYCYEHLHGSSAPCDPCKLARVVGGGTEKWEYTFPGGKTYEVFAAPFTDSDRVVCQLATYRNITHHKQAEQELINLNRMKSELLSNVSHELRSPLTSIKGIVSSLAQESVRLDEDTKKMLLRGVIEETDRLAGLVTNLLNMSKLEAGGWQPEKERCHIADIINDAMEQQRWVHQNHVFKSELEPGLPEFYADFSQIKQVLTNLLDNASAYSDEGTEIAVRAWVADGDIAVGVSDRGAGIPPEDMEKIFQKFYRGTQKRNRPGGTGLGLAICRAIVTGHGGRIWAESQVGRGSTFYFRLPITVSDDGQSR